MKEAPAARRPRRIRSGQTPAAPDGGRLRRLHAFFGSPPPWLLAALGLSVLLASVLIWWPRYLAFQDHPSHLARLHALIHYGRQGSDAALYYLPNLGLIPNQFSDLLIVGLGRMAGMTADTAARVFLTLYALALPAALLWFLRVFNPRAPEYALLASLLTFNYFLFMGNENFVAGIPAFLALLAQWGGGWSGRVWKARAGGAALATVLYLCHMVAFGSAVLVIGAAALAAKWPWRERFRELAIFMPGLLLFLLYTASLARSPGQSDTQIVFLTPFSSAGAWAGALADGLRPDILSETPWLSALYGVVLAVFTVAGLGAGWKTLPRPLLAGVGLLTGAALLLPEWAGVWRPGQRMALLALLALTAAFPAGGRWRMAFCVLAIPLVVVLRWQELRVLRAHSDLIARAVAPFRDVPLPREKGGTVYPVVTEPYVRIRPLHRVFEYYHLRHGGVSPFQIVASDYSLRYRDHLADPAGVYESASLPADDTTEFDVILLIGKKGERGPEWQKELERRGWVERSGNELTGVFTRPAR